MKKISTLFLIIFVIAGLGIWFGCSKENNNVVSPAVESQNAAKIPADVIERVIAIQAKHTSKLMGLKDVVGTATGIGQDGNPAILVLTKVQGVRGIPTSLDGVPVVVEVTGEIKALAPPKSTTLKPTSKWPLPVPIGVSTGNVNECSAGTIGCRVKDANGVYALSNNHVYARENKAGIDDKILQPGLYDTNCSSISNNVIGTLSRFGTISFTGDNTIDAAIALSSSNELGNSTPSGGYGVPNSSTLTASISMQVQKYGRTSSLTKGTITGINATISVGYSTGNAVFVNQIIVKSNKPFIKSGDSGSLLVTNNTACNPVGLLFAGNSSGNYAIANQIGEVLTELGVTIDGK